MVIPTSSALFSEQGEKDGCGQPPFPSQEDSGMPSSRGEKIQGQALPLLRKWGAESLTIPASVY
jgi:hypothetical protein